MPIAWQKSSGVAECFNVRALVIRRELSRRATSDFTKLLAIPSWRILVFFYMKQSNP